MASPHEPDPQAARPAIPSSGVRLRPGLPAAKAPAEGPRWRLGLAALALLCLFHPLFWGAPTVPLWSPPAGMALVLVAWFGPGFATITLIASGLLLLLGHASAGLFKGDMPSS